MARAIAARPWRGVAALAAQPDTACAMLARRWRARAGAPGGGRPFLGSAGGRARPAAPPTAHSPPPHLGRDAGACFERAAEMQVKLGATHEAAAACVEAAKCYQKTDKAGGWRGRGGGGRGGRERDAAR